MNLLIVDDEPNVIKRILGRIDFTSLGINDIRTAYNSESALDQCVDWTPNILLSDIVMPGSNGIHMAHDMRQKWPDLQVIFISGYMEKEFLKGAIQLQAVNYIEKPIDMTELQAILKKTVQIVSERLETKQRITSLEQEQNFSFLQTIALQIASERYDSEKVKSNLLKILPEEGLMQPCFALQICIYEERSNKYSFMKELLRDVKNAADTVNLMCFPAISSDYIIAFLISHSGNISENKVYFVTEYCHELRAKLINNHVPYTLGVGHVGKNWTELHSSLYEAIDAGKFAFFHELGYHSYYHQIKNTVYFQENNELEELLHNLKNTSRRACIFKIHEFVTDISTSESNNPDDIKHFFSKLILDVYTQGNEEGFSLYTKYHDVNDLILAAMDLPFLSDMRQMLIEGVDQYYDAFEQDYYDNEIVNWIIRYIRQNYTDPELDLTTLSRELNLSPTYLIHLFKSVTGDTIRHYITSVRMEMAVKLLKDPSNRINDIAVKVGYRSGTYFSSRFKAYFGYVPTDIKAGKS